MSRAWLSLLRGDLAAAFAFHPLFWLPVPAAALLLFQRRLPKRVFRVKQDDAPKGAQVFGIHEAVLSPVVPWDGGCFSHATMFTVVLQGKNHRFPRRTGAGAPAAVAGGPGGRLRALPGADRPSGLRHPGGGRIIKRREK